MFVPSVDRRWGEDPEPSAPRKSFIAGRKAIQLYVILRLTGARKAHYLVLGQAMSIDCADIMALPE